MDIVEHRLAGVPFVATDNMGGAITPTLLVIHYTVTQSMAGTIAAFKSKDRPVSAHVIVDADGSCTQMVPFNRKAWHAGPSQWAGRPGCNDFAIGIELVNPGPVLPQGGGYVDVNMRPWKGGVIEAKHKSGRAPWNWNHWATYTEAQLAKLQEIGVAVVNAYSLRDVAGHDDIAPTRKFDPGPAFPMDSFRSSLFGRRDDGPELYAATTVLNVRKGPAVSFDLVPGSPLQKGQKVQVVEQPGTWWHVVTPDAVVEGFVHSSFLTPA